MKSIQKGGLTFADKQYFENEHQASVQTMNNNLIDMLGCLNDAIEEEVDDDR